MIATEIRSFTEAGLDRFRAWLAQAEAQEPKRWSLEPPPKELLFDGRYARPIGFGSKIASRRFERKFDLGMEVCGALGRDGCRELMADAGAWAWLSLFFWESVFLEKNGRWFTGDASRHVVQTIRGRKQDQSHRHLVKGAVTNVYRFGPDARVLMGEASGQSKIEEQVMSRRADLPLAFHAGFVHALYRLYWDVDADDLKRGARSDGAGSVMQLIDLLTQFDFTYDIASLRVDDVLGLLPKDFARYRDELRGRRKRSKTESVEEPAEASA